MARFLSAAWVQEVNAALAGLELDPAEGEGSLAVDSGNFSIAQVVHGAPGHDGAGGAGTEVCTVLVAEAGALRLAVTEGPEADGDRPDVVISLSYPDAAELSRGTLRPADALAAGRIRVRGDLAVLVAGQRLMAAAAARLAELGAQTTY